MSAAIDDEVLAVTLAYYCEQHASERERLREMRAFDRLTPEMREFLNDCVLETLPSSIAKAIRKFGMDRTLRALIGADAILRAHGERA